MYSAGNDDNLLGMVSAPICCVVFVKIQMMHGTSLFLIEIDQIVMMMVRVKVLFL